MFNDGVGTVGIFYRGSAAGASNGKITYLYGANHENTTALINNVWNYIAVVSNAGNVTFYRNGVADGTSSSAVSFAAAEMGNDGASDSLKASLDDVRIYNRALSPSEVKLLYNSGK